MKKKLLSILLCGFLLISLTGCGEQEKRYSVNDTMINDNWEVTLKSVEFVDFINLETEIVNGGKKGVENLGLSIEPTDPKYKMIGQNGNVILSYTLEYKYVGKEQYKDQFYDVGKTRVVYNNEYTFSENYFNFVRDSNQINWLVLSNDIDQSKVGLQNMLAKDNTYKTLDDTNYLVRGFILVPEKVKSDTESSLTIQFREITDAPFTIR